MSAGESVMSGSIANAGQRLVTSISHYCDMTIATDANGANVKANADSDEGSDEIFWRRVFGYLIFTDMPADSTYHHDQVYNLADGKSVSVCPFIDKLPRLNLQM